MILPAALVLDFDGTITTGDIGDLVCGRFSDPAWLDIDHRWIRGELSLTEAQRQMWALCRCSFEQGVAYAREVGHLRPGFAALLDLAERHQVPVWLASGGFDFYIESLLGEHLRRMARRYYNTARFPAAQDGVVVDFPHGEVACDRCAVCKGRVCLLAAQGQRGPVVFVGDGYSDRCVLDHGPPPEGRRIFAVRGGALEREAQARGVEVIPFDDFTQVGAAVFIDCLSKPALRTTP